MDETITATARLRIMAFLVVVIFFGFVAERHFQMNDRMAAALSEVGLALLVGLVVGGFVPSASSRYADADDVAPGHSRFSETWNYPVRWCLETSLLS